MQSITTWTSKITETPVKIWWDSEYESFAHCCALKVWNFLFSINNSACLTLISMWHESWSCMGNPMNSKTNCEKHSQQPLLYMRSFILTFLKGLKSIQSQSQLWMKLTYQEAPSISLIRTGFDSNSSCEFMFSISMVRPELAMTILLVWSLNFIWEAIVNILSDFVWYTCRRTIRFVCELFTNDRGAVYGAQISWASLGLPWNSLGLSWASWASREIRNVIFFVNE